MEASIGDQFQLLKSEVVQLSKHLDAAFVETKTINKLEGKRKGNNQQKNKLIHKLVELHEREILELNELKINKLQLMEQCEKESQKRVRRIDMKIRVLEEELKSLALDKTKRTNQHSLNILDLEDNFKKIESRIFVEKGSEAVASCSACSDSLSPGVKIFQCQEGVHLICGHCVSVNTAQCPCCHSVNYTRNRAMEAVVKSIHDKFS